MQRLRTKSLVELFWERETVADIVSEIVAAFICEEREEVQAQVVPQARLDDWFSEDVVEVFVLHQAVATGLEDCCAGQPNTFVDADFSLPFWEAT